MSPEARAKLRESMKKKRSCPNFRAIELFNQKCYKAIKVAKFHKKWHQDTFGCPVECVRLYLEEQFSYKMTWKNYGKYWQIDHITPTSYFTIDNISQAWHYTNLRPLTVLQNKRKAGVNKRSFKRKFLK